jgi:hypothetical protein
VIALLVCLAIWPILHRLWVAHSGVSPWKFYGWAMYCQPRFRSQLEFRGLSRSPTVSTGTTDEGRLLRYPRRRLDAWRALFAYRRKELAWLRQTDPDDLARAVFAAHPGLRYLALRRHWTRYDTRVSMPVNETEVLLFERLSDTVRRYR